jgi:hypothetical protein
MPAYSEGKIYKITAPSTDRIYIGSTTMPLAYRFGEHRRQFLRGAGTTRSRELLGLPGVRIELLENYPCTDRAALCRREGEHIRQHRDICVNHAIAGRTQSEWVADNRQRCRDTWNRWAARHPDKIQEINAKKRAERAASKGGVLLFAEPDTNQSGGSIAGDVATVGNPEATFGNTTSSTPATSEVLAGVP